VIQLCGLYAITGRAREAEPFAVRALEYRRRVLGSLHPYTADAAMCMSVVAAETGRGDTAEALAREALRIYVAADLSDQWVGDLARAVLGRALLAQKRYPEAEASLLAAYRGFRATWPNGVSFTSWTRRQLIALYEAWGRPERAAQFRR
jgi:serine/threonine-protein kinase